MEIKSRNSNIIKFLLIPVFFPWVNFGLGNNWDTQPFALISILFAILLLKEKVSLYTVILLLAISIILLGSQFFVPTEPFYLLRSLFGFAGFLLFYEFFYRRADLIIKFYRFVLLTNTIWIMGGIIELIFPEFIGLFAKQRTTIGRGMTSFSPEPGYFGFVLVNYLILLTLIRRVMSKSLFIFFQFSNILCLLFVAQSAIAIMYLFVLISVLLAFYLWKITSLRLSKKQTIYVFILVLSSPLLLVIFTYFSLEYSDIRVFKLLAVLSEKELIGLVSFDASINHRVEHLVLPWIGSFSIGGLPAGAGAFDYSRDYLPQHLRDFFWRGGADIKVMSWIGDWVITFGIFGFLFLVRLFYVSHPLVKKNQPYFWAYLIILFSATPIANPLVPLTLALFAKSHYLDHASGGRLRAI